MEVSEGVDGPRRAHIDKPPATARVAAMPAGTANPRLPSPAARGAKIRVVAADQSPLRLNENEAVSHAASSETGGRLSRRMESVMLSVGPVILGGVEASLANRLTPVFSASARTASVSECHDACCASVTSLRSAASSGATSPGCPAAPNVGLRADKGGSATGSLRPGMRTLTVTCSGAPFCNVARLEAVPATAVTSINESWRLRSALAFKMAERMSAPALRALASTIGLMSSASFRNSHARSVSRQTSFAETSACDFSSPRLMEQVNSF